MTLLYEFTHLNPAYFSLTTSPNPLFDDYVYGSANCASLAVGRSTASQAIKNTDNWVFVTLDAYCSDKSKKQIELDFSDSRLYASIDGQSPGCLLGDQNQWIISARGSCSASGVASNPKASGGPGGCGIPDISGLNGVNVADCWQFPQGTTAVEITLAVTNATKVRLFAFTFKY